ncbi:dehydrogenase/reductase SDR family member on chromosome X-like [Nasonia vitripennis]|uniref:Short-chain dehydrogenase n=1 Tax=Nasonia vitripennis TaxID=7425 RepID=A0A7M7QJU8_NASVI|nr:dehydrogenase/reductase SDR family member on chromosome X-like [Nasonia vitripennis]
MSGRVAIVTGGARGMGAEIVRILLECDMDVIVACRNKAAGEKTVAKIREAGVLTGKARVMKLDNSSLDSVRNFVEEFKNNYYKVDVLINNAGVMFVPYKESDDGFEQQYIVNYLSHFLLTSLLVPFLKKAGSSDLCSRIVNVSSCAHLLGKINFNDINNKEDFFDTEAAYMQSKLAQVLSTKWYARFFEKECLNIKVHAVHPGIVNTDLFFHDQTYLKYYNYLRNVLLKSPAEGAKSIVYAAISPRVEGKNGLYLSNCLEAPVHPTANDQSLQDRLLEYSLKQVRLDGIST